MYKNFYDITINLVLPTLGIVYIICDSDVFSFPRRLLEKIPVVREMVQCQICTAFWVGLSIILTSYLLIYPSYIKIFMTVMALLGALLLLDKLILRLGEKDATEEED